LPLPGKRRRPVASWPNRRRAAAMNECALSVREVAELLGIRRHGILFLIKSGQLRACDVSLKLGGRPHWKILPSDLEAFLLRRTYQASPPRRRRRNSSQVKAYF
jgi:excisionase family DNA binding protein